MSHKVRTILIAVLSAGFACLATPSGAEETQRSPFVKACLANLMRQGHIAEGVVNEPAAAYCGCTERVGFVVLEKPAQDAMMATMLGDAQAFASYMRSLPADKRATFGDVMRDLADKTDKECPVPGAR